MLGYLIPGWISSWPSTTWNNKFFIIFLSHYHCHGYY
nr:MAG TPA: hypothetical protein [Caudoviricetes sp.]